MSKPTRSEKKPLKSRPDAILIEAKGDLSYSEILKLVTRSQDDKMFARFVERQKENFW